MDAAWLHMDRPANTADVVAVLSFADRLPLPRLRSVIERRLLAHRRFRQRVVHRALDRAAWEDDPGFSLERHLRHRRLDGGREALATFVGEVATEPLDPARPLWRVDLVDGVGEGSAVVAKLHHCLGDGFALLAVLLSLADDPPPARAAPRRARPAAPTTLPGLHGAWETLRGGLLEPARALDLLGASAAFAASLARMAALPPDPDTALKRPLAGERRAAWSEPLPLRELRTAARTRGATVNDLLVTALAGALRTWLRAGGQSDPPDVRALVPVNLRSPRSPAALGNAFGLVFADLPLATATPDERLARVHAGIRTLRSRPDPAVTFAVLSLLGRLPPPLERLVNAFFTSKASLVMTNVPGPRRRLHLAGHRLEDVMFWVPHPSSLGLGVSILSYGGAVRVGVRADTAVMLRPAALVACFEAEVARFVQGGERAGSRPRARRASDAIVSPGAGADSHPA